ncbi:AAA family ATPase [Mariprofundus sp. NF]|uniref:AAA family ATPase n=1 Tax=Mariprofundus sp. NF TaxID=2608716 RepID=UPI0015A4EED3|nr:AAA family ATPase [Mariprofundus sp. NF]NWF37981.1 AAA family ATPase [Mariprofundus sp. NF]
MSYEQKLNEFIKHVERLRRVNRVAVIKQNKIMDQLMKKVAKMDDGFLVNDQVISEFSSLIPSRLYISSKHDFDSASKALCQKIFKDRMHMLNTRLETLWDGEGCYPIASLFVVMQASELVSISAKRITADTVSKGDRAYMNLLDAFRDNFESYKSFLVREIKNSEYKGKEDLIYDAILSEYELFMYELECLWCKSEVKNKRQFQGGFRARKDTSIAHKKVKCKEPSIQLCDSKEVKKLVDLLRNSQKKNHEVYIPLLEDLLTTNGRASLAMVPKNYKDVLVKFRLRFPHLSTLADEIEMNLCLSMLGGSKAPLKLFDSMYIFDGPPGVGKTAALHYLAKEFGVKHRIIGAAELTNGFDISGQSRGWGTGKPGHVANLLIENRMPNCLIIMDEIDKMIEGSNNFPPAQPLYTLLERMSAKRFRDEFYDFEIDASFINWAATSNNIKRVPEPIRDRAHVINVSCPSLEQRIQISSILYEDLLAENKQGWGKCFFSEIGGDIPFIVASVDGISIRGMQQIIMRSISLVANRVEGQKITSEQLELKDTDVLAAIQMLGMKGDSKSQNGIGFILN